MTILEARNISIKRSEREALKILRRTNWLQCLMASVIIFNAFTLQISSGLVVAAALYATRQDADYIFSKMAKLTRYRDVLRPSNATLLFGFYIIPKFYCICSVL